MSINIETIKYKLIIYLLAIVFSHSCMAGEAGNDTVPWERFPNSKCLAGKAAADKGEYAEAIYSWGKISPSKIISEQYYATNKCLIRMGFAKSLDDAKQWYYDMATKEGIVEAELLLAFYYQLEVDVFVDDIEAIDTIELSESVKWATSAASKGLPEAKAFLAINYLNGLGVKKDINHGMQLLIKAAEGGSIYAIDTLLDVYKYGKYGQMTDCEDIKRWCLYAYELSHKLGSDIDITSRCEGCCSDWASTSAN